MRQALKRSILFTLERFLVRGAHYRLLVVIAAIGLTALLGGLLVTAGSDPTLAETEEAIWWAFLRLTDPGYLGDDHGVWRRLVSTLLTVLGYVLFLGAMVAILTQWLNNTLARLEMGLTPIRMNGHIAIIGWTNRTRIICRDLVSSEGSVRRWLARRGVRRLQIAVLAPKVGPEQVQDLRDALEGRYHRRRFVLRSGSALRASHLARVDFGHAATVVIPGIDATSSNAEIHDDAVIKTLTVVSASNESVETLPTCVCEMFDPRKIPVARRAYRGRLEVVASDVVVGRLLAYSAREPGLSEVCAELVTHGVGGTLYVVPWEGDEATFGSIVDGTRGGVVIGFVREIDHLLEAILCPESDRMVARDDRLVVVAHAFEDIRVDLGQPEASKPTDLRLTERDLRGGRILIVGWSSRLPDLLMELDRNRAEQWEVDIVSAAPVGDREADMADHDARLERIKVRHLLGDVTVPSRLMAFEPGAYDRIVLMASDWLQSGDASDARTISAFLAFQEVLEGDGRRPPMVVELTDAANADLFDRNRTEVVVGPEILAHVLAQVVLRRDLRTVIDDLFGSGGSDLHFARVNPPSLTTFSHVASAARQQGALALGIRRGGVGGMLLLAPDGQEPVDGTAQDEVILISTDDR